MTGPDQHSAALLLRARQGDRAALGQLLDEQRAQLRYLADRLLDNRIRGRLDASDLVQQTCLSVHKRIAEFEGSEPGQFVAWLRQVHEHNIRNAVRDHLQAGRRAADRDIPLGQFDVPARATDTPSRRLIRDEDNAKLRNALERLPPDEKQALRLRYIEGRTVAEVANEMGLSRDALIWLMRRALQRIRSEAATDSQL